MQNTPNYHFSADLIRALAIIAVVIIHVFGELINTSTVFQTGDWWFANFLDSAMRPAVPLFILLSGFLLLDKSKTYGGQEFLKKRFFRIGIPLIVWPFLYYLWNLYLRQQVFHFKDFIIAYITLNIFYHLYFLFVIAGIYLLAPMVRVYLAQASQKNKVYALSLAFLFSIAITGFHYHKQIGLSVATVATVFLPYFAYFLAGDYLRNVTLNKKRLTMYFLTFLGLAVITALLNSRYMEHIGWSKTVASDRANFDRYFYDYLSVTVIPMSLVIFVVLMNLPNYIRLKPVVKKLVSSLSLASFGIYLIHPFFLDVSNRFWHLEPTRYSPIWLFLIGKTILIFLLSYATVLLLRKIKGLRMIFG